MYAMLIISRASLTLSKYIDPIPGPTVWSGAAPSPTAPAFGTNIGLQTNVLTWSTWVNGYTTTKTITESTSGTLTSFVYTPTWSTTYNTPGVTHSTTTSATTTMKVITTSATKQTSTLPIQTTTTTAITTTTKPSTTTTQPISTGINPPYQ